MANQRSPPYVDFQAGSGTTDASGNATVSFARSFSKVPKVFLQGIDSGAKGIVLDVVSKTVAGFAVKARKVTGLPTGQALKGIHYEKNYGLINIRYTVASAVTGIPNVTGYGGPNHTHGFSTGGPSSYVSPVDVIAAHDPTSGPSTTTKVASNTHLHGSPITSGGHNSSTITGYLVSTYSSSGYYAATSGGSPTVFFRPAKTYKVEASYLYGAHTHTVTLSAPSEAAVASSTHTHTVSAHMGTRVDAASKTHTHSGTTGGASAYSHRHSIGSPSSASFVDSLDVPAPPDPTYWKEFVTSLSIWDPDDLITVVVGGAPVVGPVLFDWLALLA